MAPMRNCEIVEAAHEPRSRGRQSAHSQVVSANARRWLRLRA